MFACERLPAHRQRSGRGLVRLHPGTVEACRVEQVGAHRRRERRARDLLDDLREHPVVDAVVAGDAAHLAEPRGVRGDRREPLACGPGAPEVGGHTSCVVADIRGWEAGPHRQQLAHRGPLGVERQVDVGADRGIEVELSVCGERQHLGRGVGLRHAHDRQRRLWSKRGTGGIHSGRTGPRAVQRDDRGSDAAEVTEVDPGVERRLQGVSRRERCRARHRPDRPRADRRRRTDRLRRPNSRGRHRLRTVAGGACGE